MSVECFPGIIGRVFWLDIRVKNGTAAMDDQPLNVRVEAEWDDEAGVWVATSDDVPGLVAEHADFGQLQKMVMELIPILLVENHLLPDPQQAYDVPVEIAARATARGHALVAAH